MTTRTMRNGAPLSGAPVPGCPKCSGPMWDNRSSKGNPKAPDFRCRNRECGGVIWPGKHSVAAQLYADVEPRGHGQPTQLADIIRGQAQRPLRKCYLAVTDFVLSEVRARYEAAGVTCQDATLAAIAATLFIAVTGRNTHGGGR